jgi:hypothetical protein
MLMLFALFVVGLMAFKAACIQIRPLGPDPVQCEDFNLKAN